MNRGSPAWRWGPVLAVTLLGLALRFWRLGELALIGDESYYWLWSRHLDWAYYDHPAGIALLVRASSALGGPGEAGIRTLNALLGAACIPLVYLLGAEMLSRRAGLLAALAVALGTPYLLTARFVYTDALQLFLLLLNLYWFWRLVSEVPRPRLWTAGAFGLSLALLFNTKYNAYLYALALAVVLLLDHRWLLREGGFWLGGLIATLGLLPVVVWNAQYDWASLRWQLSHLAFNVSGESSLVASISHSLAYLSWPLVALALMGLARAVLALLGLVLQGQVLPGSARERRPAERLLVLVALFLLLPVALSPASSPRNLSSGLVALFLLAGSGWTAVQSQRRQRWLRTVLAVILGLVALYGLGTLANLSRPSPLPHSSAVRDIRRDAAGWRELGPELSTYPAPVFALDYSIASQIWYYSGRPAFTAWPQYRIWGIPEIEDATVVSLDYLPEDLVTERLRAAFQIVAGPRRLSYKERGATKEARIWQAEALHLDQEAFLQRFDFLHLLEAAQ